MSAENARSKRGGALRGGPPPPQKLLVLFALLAACAPYRTYPLLSMEPPGRAPLEPTGIAVLEDGRVVTIAEGDARALLVPHPDGLDPIGSALTIFPLTDGRDTCETPACRARAYRAGVRLREEPIRWLPRERRVTTPYNVEDLAPFGKDRVLGVTEYSTIGRLTGYRKDYVARPRRQTERLFVLERTVEGWQEIEVPEIERLRGALSDWGRASCDGDMLVEGLAWDPDDERVYIGLRRCGGPVVRVLGWNLGSAKRGLAADLQVVADGVEGAPAGPEEGVSALNFSQGRLWALTAWDSYGHDVEPAFGGRLHEVLDGRLHPVDLPGPFEDRPAALAVLPSKERGEGLDAIVLFDNDADAVARPEMTVLHARTPRPAKERFAELLDVAREPEPLKLGLNGFDFRWWVRDHRLGHLAAVLDEKPSDNGPVAGAWTRALGGLWQMRIGASLGLGSRWLPAGVGLGYNKQAVAFTDFGATDLDFTRYRARLTVVPRDRLRRDRSLAGLLDENRSQWRVTVPLEAAAPGAGLVLQGFEIDTSSRADRGICLAAMELGVSWHDDKRDAVDLQATLIGGVCNDFDARGPDYFHGLTTAVDGGVLVTLHYAVVEGAESVPWSVAVYDEAPPRAPEGSVARDARRDMDDAASRAHMHCVRVSAEGTVEPRARSADAPPDDWLSQGMTLSGAPAAGPTALSGFALALDPAGFDPVSGPRPLTEEESLARNNYIYRYLVRALPDSFGTFVEGGITHGIHLGGPMRDNALPSALAMRADLTTFPGLQGAVAHDIVYPRRRDDPNLLPEDGYVRWSVAQPAVPEPTCSPSW